ncbi:hypothetical protein K488DRAFT_90893 [Vararia minispora EC-137]|uniref:Uncharacterized protein n=1 Tax=Vararia minispora EC-137 TaxID=1314806 RepID=A0ACB8Q6X9_9AGAM|nr:hypothetical protein K488DRAFT_90893 [Vararia minispora EC-137]
MFFLFVVVVLSIFSLVPGRALSISPGCQSAITSIAFSQKGVCLNVLGLGGSLLIMSLNGSASFVQPLDSWAQSICSQPACSNQTLSSIVGKLAANCSADVPFTDIRTLAADFQEYYPAFREALCLKNATSNQLCITDILTSIEDTTGTFTPSKMFFDMAIAIRLGGLPLPTPPDLACSDCMQAATLVFSNHGPGNSTSSVKPPMTDRCGSSQRYTQSSSTIIRTSSNGSVSSSASLATRLRARSVLTIVIALVSALVLPA